MDLLKSVLQNIRRHLTSSVSFIKLLIDLCSSFTFTGLQWNIAVLMFGILGKTTPSNVEDDLVSTLGHFGKYDFTLGQDIRQ